MIKKTLHYLWGKKFAILLLALIAILLPNSIARDLQVRTTTVITAMDIERSDDEIIITAQKFKSPQGEESKNEEIVVYQGKDVREMLADVSLAHCKSIKFKDEPDLDILHALYHFQDLRGNTKVNNDQTISDILKSHDYHCQ